MQLPVGIQQSLVWYVAAWPPQPLSTHRPALCISFRTTTLTYCLPPFYRRGLLSINVESTLTQACLDGPLLAQVYRKPCFGTVACLTLIWTLNRPSYCVYNDILLLYRRSVSSVIKSKNPNLLSKAFDPAVSHKNHQMLLCRVTTQYACVNTVFAYHRLASKACLNYQRACKQRCLLLT